MTQKQTQPLSHPKSVNNKTEIEKKVTSIIADHLEKDVAELNFGLPFEDLDLDEFDITELVMKWEDSFGVIIEDSDISLLTNVDSVVQFIIK
jgi:acyl carrier protein